MASKQTKEKTEMNLKEATGRFECLQKKILADGKIDIVEIDIMLAFIESYCQKKVTEFIELKNILLAVKEDGKVSKLEQQIVIDAFKRVSAFLKIERQLEFGVIISIIIAVGLIAGKLMISLI